MRYFLIFITLFIFSACYSHAQSKIELSADWKTVSDCTVSIDIPPDTRRVDYMLADGCISQYKSKNILIYIETDLFRAQSSAQSNRLDYCVSKINIDQLNAEIFTQYDPITSGFDSGFDYRAELIFNELGKGEKGFGSLRIDTLSKTPEDREKAMQILRSVRINKL